jgi:uncharacterized protein
MITRLLEPLVRERLRRFPAVGLLGPRQCGKTTLAKKLGDLYFDLEQPRERLRLDGLWDDITASSQLVALDEAQCWPEVFPRLRGAIDAQRRKNSRFLVLGSVSPELTKQVSESLAGRLSPLELTPLQAAEVPAAKHEALWRAGGFPDGGLLDKAAFPSWQHGYLHLMTRRDLPQWGLPAKPTVTNRLFHLLAAAHGSHQNNSKFGQTLGLSHHTISGYLDFLEGAFLIRRLPPYFPHNITKRLVKTPKLYWRDTGLLHALLGLGPKDDLFSQDWIGESWEGWVIEQILAWHAAHGHAVQPYYFRTSDGLECDLLLVHDGMIELVEIKLTTNPRPEDMARLRQIRSLVKADRIVLLTRARDSVTKGAEWFASLPRYLEALSQ